MEKLEFYIKLKEAIESDFFRQILIEKSSHSLKQVRSILERVLFFLISTRDFENFNYYLERLNNEQFPYQYLKMKRQMTTEQAQQFIFENFIKDGFLFHVTSNKNIGQILEKGILTLNDKYRCNVYEKCLELDRIYHELQKRNKNNQRDFFRLRSVINVPGKSNFTEDRFDTVYLSSKLDYLLDTYGEIGEFSMFLIEDLFYAFNGSYGLKKCDNKEKQKEKIVHSIRESGIIINEEELNFILEFIEIFGEDNKSKAHEKAILMVPSQCIQPKNSSFNMLYRENKLNLPVEKIIEYNDGEVENRGSIDPKHIVAIVPEDDVTFKVKMKTQ